MNIYSIRQKGFENGNVDRGLWTLEQARCRLREIEEETKRQYEFYLVVEDAHDFIVPSTCHTDEDVEDFVKSEWSKIRCTKEWRDENRVWATDGHLIIEYGEDGKAIIHPCAGHSKDEILNSSSFAYGNSENDDDVKVI
jgi:hypothetical protein